MTDAVSTSAPAVLQEYYRVLTAGTEAFGDGQGLRALLSSHLDFTGSLAGHRADATDGFLRGVAGFVSTVRSITVLREVHGQQGSAVLYDAEMPGGPVRFAEFFAFGDGVIDTLVLHDDGQDYLAKGPVTPPTPSPSDALAQRLRAALASHQDVREVRMFGGLSFMVDQRLAVAAGRGGDLLVRTDPAEYDDLLQRGGEPARMGGDRPMGRGWLSVPQDRVRSDEELAYWVEVGIDSRKGPS